MTTFNLRFHLTSGDPLETPNVDDDVLNEVLRLLADPNAVIQIPVQYRFTNLVIIPVRSVVHVEKF